MSEFFIVSFRHTDTKTIMTNYRDLLIKKERMELSFGLDRSLRGIPGYEITPAVQLYEERRDKIKRFAIRTQRQTVVEENK